MKDISVVVPAKDEALSLPRLVQELHQVLSKLNKSFEIIFIDDGSVDTTYQILQKLQSKYPQIHLIRFRVNFGKSQALAAGFAKASGRIIVTIDADLQDDPQEIPKLLAVLSQGFDLVTGWRKKRVDTPLKLLSSHAFNLLVRILTGVALHDINCGLKVMRREVADELYLHGELHRFIPVLAAKKKFRVTEIPVTHHARAFGVSKYGSLGIGRSWQGILDLLTTIFLTDYSGKPAHFFGRIGMVFFGAGFLMDAYVTYLKVTTGSTQAKIPLLLAGILFMVLGTQLLSTGLIAEMIAYYFLKRKRE